MNTFELRAVLWQQRWCSTTADASSNDFKQTLHFVLDAVFFRFSVIDSEHSILGTFFDCRLVISFIEINKSVRNWNKCVHKMPNRFFFLWLNRLIVHRRGETVYLQRQRHYSLSDYSVKTNPKKNNCICYFCLDDFFPCIVMFFDFYTAIVISWFHEMSNQVTCMTVAVHCQCRPIQVRPGWADAAQ